MSDLLNQASLVMIPSGYKEDVVYSQIPLDGSGDMAFTRASNGTRINSQGLVEVCPWNLVGYSEEFNNAYWTKNRSSITANSTSAPNGTTTADSLIENTANGTHEFITVLATQLQSYNFSIYAKANTRSKIQLVLAGTPWATGGNGEASFDLSLGTVISAVNGATGTIENVGNGWYRCTIAKPTSVADPSGVLAVRLLDASGNSSYTGNGTSGAYYWGAQLNIGTTAKPYFPTTDRLNVPRLTYQNGGGGCPSLLLEKQSTNGVYPSEDFTNANWQNYGGASVTANTAISPDGTQNADTLDSGTTTALYNPNGVSGGAIPFTASIYVKKVNFEVFRFGMTDDTLEEFSYNYNLDTGAISSASSPTVWTNTSGTITSVGNGWYRLTVTGTKGALGVARMVVKGQSSSKQYYIWGAQLEASSYATSYIPTTSSSATRVADACYKTGISSLIGQTEGVIFYDGVLTGISNAYANLINGEKNTTGSFSIGQRNTGAILCGFFVGGSSVVTFDAGSYAVGTRTKIAFAYKSGSSVLYVNGSQLATSTATFTPVENIDDIFIGDPTTFFNYKENTQVNQVALFKTRLTNAELASITSL